jgi:prolipoprotein diacylglyceryltransferase
MEFTLLIAAAMAVAAGSIALRWEAARGNAVDCAADLWDVFLGAAVSGLFVGRLAAMVASGVNPFTNPGDILIVRGGVATGWATLAAIAVVGFMSRGEARLVADSLAVAALAALAGWHLGCLPREACLGTPSDLPWAMTQAGSTVGRHPVELYAAGLLVAAAIVLARRRRRPLPIGLAAGYALLVAATVRLVTEPLRPGLGGGPTPWYVAGILVGAGWIVLGIRRAPSRA